MLENLIVGSEWTQDQWLIVSIIAFVILASILIIFRLYKILKMSTKKRERPVLRAGRRVRR